MDYKPYKTKETVQDLVKPVEPLDYKTNENLETTPEELDTSSLETNNALATFHSLDLDSSLEPKQEEEADDSSQEVKSDDTNDSNAISDERCKRLFGEAGGDLLKAITDINEYVYNYTEEAKNLPNAEAKGVDSSTHLGPVAQELKENPVTESSVEEDPLTGFLTVDTKKLTLTEMSILTAMAKRILALEEKVNGR